MSNMLKDRVGNIYEWWKNEKISGTLMPIFILLNILKFQTDTAYTVNELIANASFLTLMIFSIMSYYRRSERLDKVTAVKDVGIDKNKREQEVAFEQVNREIEQIEKDRVLDQDTIDLDREKFNHKKDVEEFSMGVVQKQREYQYSLITEQADFINEQIINKTDHIVYVTKNFELNDKMMSVIKMHEDEIEILRLYQRNLPAKIEMRFKDFLMSNKDIPRVRPAPEVIESELNAILKNVNDNIEIQSVKDDIIKVPIQ